MANIPPELINQILLVSPVKSLLRFKCLSKCYNATISSQDFINSHLCTSSDKRIHRKLICIRNCNNRTDIYALDINNRYVKQVRINLELPFIIPCPLFVASCNGLLLLNLSYKHFSLWNPYTRNYKELPVFPGEYNPGSFYDRSLHSGFGYDSTTDDYKVLQIICTTELFFCPEVWIFYLRTNCWRNIPDFPYTEYTNIQKPRVGNCFVDGYVYFLCYGLEGRESHIIVAFDVAKETFSVIPEPIYQNRGKHILLNAFDACLSIAVHSETRVDLYARKKIKEGVEYTWTKLFSFIEERPICPKTIGYSKGGDTFLFYSGGNIYSYDLKERSLVKIKTDLALIDLCDYIFCVESLVSVGAPKEKKNADFPGRS